MFLLKLLIVILSFDMDIQLAIIGLSVLKGHSPCVDFLEDIMYSNWISYYKRFIVRDLWK